MVLAMSEVSLVGVSFVIGSTPLATSSVSRYSDIELLVLSLFPRLKLLSFIRWSSAPSDLPVFRRYTAAATSS